MWVSAVSPPPPHQGYSPERGSPPRPAGLGPPTLLLPTARADWSPATTLQDACHSWPGRPSNQSQDDGEQGGGRRRAIAQTHPRLRRRHRRRPAPLSARCRLKDGRRGESFLASPTLHIILYVNVLFFIFSWFTEILLLQPRFQEMEQRFRILTQVVVTYFTVTDIIRLYLGTAGNQGKVRLLTLFLGLTVVMMASCLLLVHSHLAAQFTPVESNLFLSAVGLQAAEMVFGGLALRTMRRMMA
ncbi:transmembrane protein 17B-like isoform X1 [Narcine bancroftii]|uniref:transmembrane protein 17B-like isoform X1 n=1 Tax=Narcine bancroftii TaxID=1343680 RepID=UPI0038320178